MMSSGQSGVPRVSRNGGRASLRCAALMSLAALVMFVPVARADPQVTIEGTGDTNSPLVIDPADDPREAQLGEMLVIDRMPVTKTITAATIGDLSTGDCSQSTTLDIQINDVTTNLGVAVSDRQPITDQFGRITWHFDPVTLLKGHRYVFATGGAQGCQWWQLRQRTWAGPLDEQTSQVEPPEYASGCLHVGHAMSGDLYGLWHVEGENDAVPCDPSPYEDVPENFSLDMPTGWLVVDQVNWIPRVYLAGSRWYTPPPNSNCPGGGQLATYWRPSPDPPAGLSDYVCTWPQFMPVGQTSDRAFAWSTPWSASGQPRIGYVKLDTIDYDSLLERYSPVLQYDSVEPFPAEPAEPMPAYAAGICGSGTGSQWRNSLWSDDDQTIPLASADECGGLPILESSWLVPGGSHYPQSLNRTFAASPDDYVDEADDNYPAASGDIYTDAAAQHGTGDTVYARAYQADDGTLWLEYWLWFYYNDGDNVLQVDNHEGDWEHIILRLGSDLSPVKAIYGEHTYASKCDWNEVERAGDRPVVYVALGRHASWFAPGTFGDWDDTNDGLGARVTPHLEIVSTTSPRWMRWPGRWGGTNETATIDVKSPRGPAFQAPWSDPGAEESTARSSNCPTLAPSVALSRIEGADRNAPRPPVLTARAEPGRRQVRVTYSVDTMRGPRRLLLGVRSTSSSLSSTTTVSVRKRHSGVVRLPLPETAGPYVLSASIVARTGRSATVQRSVP